MTRDSLDENATDYKSKPGIGRVFNATIYSAQGLKTAWTNEVAFRQELIWAAIMIPIAIVLPVAMLQKLALIGVVVFVLVVELINSAIEAVVDRISDDIHVLSGNAKDMGSAAVLISLLFAVVVWAAVLWNNFVAS